MYLTSERANRNGLTRAPFKNFDPVPQTALGGFVFALRSRWAFSLLSTVILSREEKKAFLLCLFLLNEGLVILLRCRDWGNTPLLKTLTFLTLTPHETNFLCGIFPPLKWRYVLFLKASRSIPSVVFLRRFPAWWMKSTRESSAVLRGKLKTTVMHRRSLWPAVRESGCGWGGGRGCGLKFSFKN